MPLTEQQITNLHKLAINDVQEIATECDEILGRVTISEYSKITGIPNRTVYDRIKRGKIKTVNGMPCINLK